MRVYLWVIVLAGAIQSAIELIPEFQVSTLQKVAIIFIATLGALLSVEYEFRERRSQEKNRTFLNSREAMLKSVAWIMRGVIKKHAPFRVCFFQYDFAQQTFEFQDGVGVFSDAERELILTSKQGVIGKVALAGTIQAYDLKRFRGETDKRRDERLMEDWHLDAAQAVTTRHVESIAAAPLYYQQYLIGILCVDSELPLGASRLNQQEVFSAMQERAAVLSKLIGKNDPVLTKQLTSSK